jgi:flagellar protein FliS
VSQRAHRYAETQALTASPGRLLVLLLTAGLRHMHDARDAFAAADLARGEVSLRKASDIVWELQRTIDRERSESLADALLDVYTNVSVRLLRAMTSHDAASVDEAARLFAPIVDAFRDVVESERSNTP